MTAEEVKIFVKFKRKSSDGLTEAFYVSLDIDKIKSWNHEKKPNARKKNSIKKGVDTFIPFQGLGKEFISKIDVFRKTVPFAMSRMPMLVGMTVENKFKKTVIEKGNLIESDDDFETYELSADDFRSQKEELRRLRAIMSGVAQIPNLFLIGLISAYDAFFSDVAKNILLSRPEIISSSDKNISFKDLIDLGSIEDARSLIIDREIENTMRGSHLDQILWLEKRANIKIRDNNPLWGRFIEVCERRNLLTHTDGAVSQQYLAVCSQNGFPSTAKIGDELEINQEYFTSAVDLILEFGLKLYQVVWRKINPDKLDIAEDEYCSICYDMLINKDYKMALSLIKFNLEEMKKFSADATRRITIINKAIAEKEMGDMESALKTIDKEDWSAVGDNYRIAILGIKNEDDKLLQLLPKAVAAGVIDASALREWPAFNYVRSKHNFLEKFKEVFGEDLSFSSKVGAEEVEVDATDNHDVDDTKVR